MTGREQRIQEFHSLVEPLIAGAGLTSLMRHYRKSTFTGATDILVLALLVLVSWKHIYRDPVRAGSEVASRPWGFLRNRSGRLGRVRLTDNL